MFLFNTSSHLGLYPLLQPHGSVIPKILVHIEGVEQHVRLVAHAVLDAVVQSHVVVIHQDRLVDRMCALLNDDLCTFTGSETAEIGVTLRRC